MKMLDQRASAAFELVQNNEREYSQCVMVPPESHIVHAKSVGYIAYTPMVFTERGHPVHVGLTMEIACTFETPTAVFDVSARKVHPRTPADILLELARDSSWM